MARRKQQDCRVQEAVGRDAEGRLEWTCVARDLSYTKAVILAARLPHRARVMRDYTVLFITTNKE